MRGDIDLSSPCEVSDLWPWGVSPGEKTCPEAVGIHVTL